MSSKRGSKPGTWGGRDPVEDGRKAGQTSKTHGMEALAARGRAALDPAEVASLDELRDLLNTHPGRIEVRTELAARTMMIVEKGYQHVEGKHFTEGGGPLRYLAVYSNLLARLLDSWPDPIEGAKDVTELMHGD